MKINSSDYNNLKADIATVLAHYNVRRAQWDSANHGETGLKQMWGLLHIVTDNRAYDDSHPMFSDPKRRVLPYIGRSAHWLYDLGLNDNHIATALGKIKKELEQELK